MSRFTPLLVLLCSFLPLVQGCETGLSGEAEENRAPQTYLLTDRIVRVGADRYPSSVQLAWWADDPDGFVTGYEWTFGDTLARPWRRTAKTDSVFLVPFPSGSDSADVTFRVRAIDNLNRRDPEPATLVIPVRNSPPVIQFNRTASISQPRDTPPDTSFHVFSFGWTVSDLDGAGNIDRVEFSVNSHTGPWQTVEKNSSLITFRIPAAGGDAALFNGTQMRAETRTVSGFQLNARNVFFMRALDITGAVSRIDSVSWFVKRQNSRILVVNDLVNTVNGRNRYQRIRDHIDSLRSTGTVTAVDVLDATDGTSAPGLKVPRSAAFPNRIVPTATASLAEWDFIYWVSDDLDRNISYASDMLRTFLQKGGKIAVVIPVRRLVDEADPVLAFLSIRRVAAPPTGSFRIPAISTTTVPPVTGIRPISPASGPTLSPTGPISDIRPFFTTIGSRALYQADFRLQRTGFPLPPPLDYPRRNTTDGSLIDTDFSETVGVINPDNNVLFFGMDPFTIGRDNNHGRLIRRLTIDELGFRGN